MSNPQFIYIGDAFLPIHTVDEIHVYAINHKPAGKPGIEVGIEVDATQRHRIALESVDDDGDEMGTVGQVTAYLETMMQDDVSPYIEFSGRTYGPFLTHLKIESRRQH